MSTYQSISAMAASLSVYRSETTCETREEALDAVSSFSAMLAGRIESTMSFGRILPETGLGCTGELTSTQRAALVEQVQSFKQSLIEQVNAAFDALGVDTDSEAAVVNVSPDGEVEVAGDDERSVTLQMVMIQYVEVRQKIEWISDAERTLNPGQAGNDYVMRFMSRTLETFFAGDEAVVSVTNEVAADTDDAAETANAAADERIAEHRAHERKQRQEASDERVRREKERLEEVREKAAERRREVTA